MDMTVTADNSSIVLLAALALLFYALRQQQRTALPAQVRRRGKINHVDFSHSRL